MKKHTYGMAITLSAVMTFSQIAAPVGTVLATENNNVEAQETSQVIDIPDMNLQAALNYHLYKAPNAEIYQHELESFQTLDLSGKQIESIEGLQYAANLEELTLSYNEEIEDISPLSDLVNLKKLYIATNRITDLQPLESLTNLEALDISRNQISNIEVLSKLRSLNYLMAEDNNISDVSPLSQLVDLTFLGLGGNEIADISPLGTLTQMRSLYLRDNQIKDISSIVNMIVLGNVHLSYNKITDISPLAHMNSSFGGLSLAGNQIEDLSPLENLTWMTSLNLTDNDITSIEPLKNMNRLQTLQLRDNKIRDISPLKYTFNDMKRLDLAYNLISDLSVIEDSGASIQYPSYEGNFLPYQDDQFQYHTPISRVNVVGSEAVEIPIELYSENDWTFDDTKGYIMSVETKNDLVEAWLVEDDKLMIRGLKDGQEEVTLTFPNPKLNKTITILQVDLTPPPAPKIEKITDQSTVIRGTAERYSSIEVRMGDKVIKEDSINATGMEEGLISIEIPKQKAGTEIQIFAIDEAENRSEPTTLVVEDATGPELLLNLPNGLTDRMSEVTGTAESKAGITVKNGDTIIGETTAADDGSFTLSFPKQNAETRLIFTATDAVGNETVHTVEVWDRTPPEVPVVGEVNDTDTVVKGTAEVDSSVSVLINGVTYGSDRSDENGHFSITIPSQKAGTELEIQAVDNRGNGSESAKVIVKEVPWPSKPVVNKMVTNETTLVEGETDPDAKVKITIDEEVIGTGTADEDGSFSISIEPQQIGTELTIISENHFGKVSEPAIVEVKGYVVFPDVTETHRFYEEIQYLTGNGIITGFPDGSFRPNETVTRAQAAIMIGRALDLDGELRPTIFEDVGSSSKASGFIASATEKGIITGFTDGTFRPGEPVTRGQMAIFLSRAFELKEESQDVFPDVSEQSSSYIHVRRILAEGITTGYPDGTFRPYAVLIRGDFSAFMARALEDRFK
jgi:Leucine-rich repeat (LRR) protein